MQRLRLSLVIPAYNEERHLRQCLQAIQAQTCAPYEVIVVNNNSTDRTGEIAAEFPFVRLLHESRQGLRFTRNTGMDAARGDIIGRIDADTYLNPHWCERVLRAFQDPQVTGVTGACYYHDMPYKRMSYKLDKACRTLAFTIGKPIFYGSNMAMRRSVWQRLRHVACMEGEFFEDCDLSIHAAELGYAVTFLRDMIVGVSARRLDDSPREFYRVMQEYNHTFAMHGVANPAASAAKSVYLGAFPLLRFIRVCYDPEINNFVLSRLLSPRAIGRPTSNT